MDSAHFCRTTCAEPHGPMNFAPRPAASCRRLPSLWAKAPRRGRIRVRRIRAHSAPLGRRKQNDRAKNREAIAWFSYGGSAASSGVQNWRSKGPSREYLSEWTCAARQNEKFLTRQVYEMAGAGEGNRTLVFSLEGCCSTIELHPRQGFPNTAGRRSQLPRKWLSGSFRPCAQVWFRPAGLPLTAAAWRTILRSSETNERR